MTGYDPVMAACRMARGTMLDGFACAMPIGAIGVIVAHARDRRRSLFINPLLATFAAGSLRTLGVAAWLWLPRRPRKPCRRRPLTPSCRRGA